MLELRMLPAREGDALWILWGPNQPQHQMLVDMGTEATGNVLRQRIEDLPPDRRLFELVVITHVDRDHIGGALTCFAESDPLDGLSIRDVWFNGWAHLSGKSINNTRAEAAAQQLERWGPAQGERLSAWLESQPWNDAFSGGPVQRVKREPLITKPLADDLKLTILCPTPDRLIAFKPIWREEVQKALRKGRLDQVAPGLEVYGTAKRQPTLQSLEDLNTLAGSEDKEDKSEANGSSIAMVLEYDGKRILLAGDAYPWDVVAALEAWAGRLPVAFDAVKVSHHGSSKNLTDDFVQAVRTPLWLFSTDGTRYSHPDAVAVARVLRSSSAPRTLCFNAPSEFNGWWDSDAWRSLFQYDTRYGTVSDGLTISF